MMKGLQPVLAVAVAVPCIAVALAACGGGGDSGGVASLNGSSGSDTNSATTTTGSKDPQEAALEFARCMRAHGVDVPDPSAGGGIDLNAKPGDSAKLDRAQKACQPLLANAAPKLSEEQQNLMQDAALAFAKCMRAHGIDMPDPTFGSGGIVIQKKSSGDVGQNPDDPKFKAAQKACQPIVNKAARKAGLPPPQTSTHKSGGVGS
jgi:hypothetical protein